MSKKILVVGGGGREHAIIKALKEPRLRRDLVCPSNGGIRYDAKCKNIKATDVETMVGLPLRKV